VSRSIVYNFPDKRLWADYLLEQLRAKVKYLMTFFMMLIIMDVRRNGCFYEGQKMEQHRIAETQKNATVTTPSGKKIKAFKPSFSASPPKSRGGGRTGTGGDIRPVTIGEESSMFTVSSLDEGGGGGDNSSLNLSRPLGTNIYAGNLKKVIWKNK
jgi:hypothetical protein